MNKHSIKLITLVFIGFFAISPMAFAQELSLTDLIQSKITERRENIRERLGVTLGTPLSPEALVIVDQIIEKFTYASTYMYDMNTYVRALQNVYAPDEKVAALIQYVDAEQALLGTIEAMTQYRKNATKENINDFSELVQSAKNTITLMGSLQLEELQMLRDAGAPAYLLNFDTCSFGVQKNGFFVDQSAGVSALELQFAVKDEVGCVATWNTAGDSFGSARLVSLSGAEIAGTTAVISKATDTIAASVSLNSEIVSEGIFAIVVRDNKNAESTTFVVPVRLSDQ